MIPPHWHDNTPTSEQRVFNGLKNDPLTADWTVLHSLNLRQSGNRPYGEVDFVVLIPAAGVFCLEVKGGRVACKDGIWTTTDALGVTHTLKRSPFAQGQVGMHELRKALESKLGRPADFYQVPFGFAVVFTDIDAPPRDIGTEPWEVIDRSDLHTGIAAHLLRAAKHQRVRYRLHGSPAQPQPDLMRAIRDALRPDFERIVARSTMVSESERRLLTLTEEQYATLDLLHGNDRCIFEGAAGTGKTLLALEYAKRCAQQGERVLLICFNRLLGEWFAAEIRATCGVTNILAGRFYKCLRDAILRSPIAGEFQGAERGASESDLFNSVFPLYGEMALDASAERFDVVVMDEAQDLMRPAVLNLVNIWLKGGLREGRWAFFGDFHRQAIYGGLDAPALLALVHSTCGYHTRASLRQNCRNTRRIGEETALLSGFDAPPYRMGQIDGSPVDYLEYTDAGSQRAALSTALSRLAAEPGIAPEDVIILSRYRFEQSAAGALANEAAFRIRPVDQPGQAKTRVPTFAFATAQGFKGMESKIVVLVDVDRIETDEDRSLLYVSMSRARSLLIVLLHVRTKGAVQEAFKKRLSELWRS
jgi:hypothetical protein